MQPRTAIQTRIAFVCVFLFAASTYAAGAEPQSAPVPREQLAAAARNAKAEFHPLTQASVAQAKTALLEALDRLDQRLTQAGPNGEDWRKYLQWAALQEAIRSEKPDMKGLSRIYAHYLADYDGLDLVWFVDVRNALYSYIVTIGAVDNPGVRTSYEKAIDRLAGSLDAYLAKPTTDSALAISDVVRWLQGAHQAPQVVAAIQQQMVYPNVFGEVSAEVVAAGIAGPVDDVTEVTDYILGTHTVGTAHTVGKTTVSLAPNAEMGVIDAIFAGTTESNNVGCHPPVTIHNSATTKLSACKRMWIHEEGLASYPSVANAETSVRIHDIQSDKGRRIVERMAWKRAGKQQSEAECIASRHAEARLNERVDDQAAEQLDRANKQYVEKYRKPFGERKLLPQMLQFSSTASTLRLLGLQAGDGHLGAPGAPPPAVEGADMTLRLHESAVNNLAFDALAGRTVHEEKVQATVTDLTGKLPEKFKGDEDGRPWAITFAARQQPVVVSFADNGFKITIHGVKYYKGTDYCEDTDVRAAYKIEKSPSGVKLVRQGPVEVVRASASPDTGGRQATARALLKRRFQKIFEPEFLGEGLELGGKWKSLGKLQPIQVDCRDGWLVIAWKRPAAAPTVAAK
jgi:hypothetical protein